MPFKILIAFLFFSSLSFGQEICDNGIDDDGDGLIDLLDDDCHCGVGLNPILIDAIPNPNFDTSSCCSYSPAPNDFLTCLDDWSYGYGGNPFYTQTPYHIIEVSSCNLCNAGSFYPLLWDQPVECTSISNNGYLGIFFDAEFQHFNPINQPTNWQELASANTCLDIPFVPGNNYSVTLEAFNTKIFYDTAWTPNAYNNFFNIDFSLYGSNNCANVPKLSRCADANWTLEDSKYQFLPADQQWHDVVFNVNPTTTINALSFAPSCGISNYFDVYNDNFILFDSIRVEYSPDYNVSVSQTGSFCLNDLILHANIDTVGGQWQWYKDSVALVGQVSDSLDVLGLGFGGFTFGGGSYTAVYMLNGRCQGAAKTLTFNNDSVPRAFMYLPETACVGESVFFDGEGFVTNGAVNSIVDYGWIFGDGGISLAEDTNYIYLNPGTYEVQLGVESNSGCFDTATSEIIIFPKPDVNFSVSETCIYDSLNFIDLSTITVGSIDSISWDFGNGTFSNDSISKALFSSPGLKNIELFAMSDTGCVDSLTLPIMVNPAPVAFFSVDDNCANDNLSLANLSFISDGSLLTYFWNFGNTITSTLETPTHSYPNEGTFDIQLIVNSDSSCVDTFDLSHISHPIPIANFLDSINCFQGVFTEISSISTGSINQINWTLGSITNSNDSIATINFPSIGTYPINLEVISEFGCNHDTSRNIIIDQIFEAEFTTDGELVCEGGCIKFTNTSTLLTGQTNYTWEFSDGQVSHLLNPEICFNSSQNGSEQLSVKLFVETETGCFDTITKNNYLNIIQIPKAYFVYSPDSATTYNPNIQFTNLSEGATFYEWNFGDNTNSSLINPFHTYPDIANIYTVQLDAIDSTETCMNSYAISITIIDDIIFYIPNIFTPNGNGFNETFSPVFYSGVNPYHFRMEIFNRWGETVFISENPDFGWNGQYGNNSIIQDGTYVWKIDYQETMSDAIHQQTGFVTIIK